LKLLKKVSSKKEMKDFKKNLSAKKRNQTNYFDETFFKSFGERFF
jgi:hypothetical protein